MVILHALRNPGFGGLPPDSFTFGSVPARRGQACQRSTLAMQGRAATDLAIPGSRVAAKSRTPFVTVVQARKIEVILAIDGLAVVVGGLREPPGLTGTTQRPCLFFRVTHYLPGLRVEAGVYPSASGPTASKTFLSDTGGRRALCLL